MPLVPPSPGRTLADYERVDAGLGWCRASRWSLERTDPMELKAACDAFDRWMAQEPVSARLVEGSAPGDLPQAGDLVRVWSENPFSDEGFDPQEALAGRRGYAFDAVWLGIGMNGPLDGWPLLWVFADGRPVAYDWIRTRLITIVSRAAGSEG